MTGVAPSSWPPRRAADTRRAPWSPQLERIIGFRIGENHWAFAFTAFGRSQCSLPRIGQAPLCVKVAVLRRAPQGLAERLATVVVRNTVVNLRNKVARGRFSAVFLVQCLTAIGARALRLNEDANQQ